MKMLFLSRFKNQKSALPHSSSKTRAKFDSSTAKIATRLWLNKIPQKNTREIEKQQLKFG